MPTTPAKTSKLAKVEGKQTTKKPIKQDNQSIITSVLIIHFTMFLISVLNSLKTTSEKRMRKPKEAIPKVLLIKKLATLAPIGPHQLFTSRFALLNQVK
jgi:hypothetical protein